MRLVEDLASRYLAIETTRSKVEEMVARQVMSKQAVDQLYEGLFLRTFTDFETFLEELFIGLLVSGAGLQSSERSVRPRIVVRTHKIARQVVAGGRAYIDWLPYERTTKRAEVFLRGGRPFADLDQTSRKAVRQAGLIRNAIAHRSRHSMERFRSHVIGSLQLPAAERRPARFLRAIVMRSPRTTYFEHFSGALLQAARTLGR